MSRLIPYLDLPCREGQDTGPETFTLRREPRPCLSKCTGAIGTARTSTPILRMRQRPHTKTPHLKRCISHLHSNTTIRTIHTWNLSSTTTSSKVSHRISCRNYLPATVLGQRSRAMDKAGLGNIYSSPDRTVTSVFRIRTQLRSSPMLMLSLKVTTILISSGPITQSRYPTWIISISMCSNAGTMYLLDGRRSIAILTRTNSRTWKMKLWRLHHLLCTATVLPRFHTSGMGMASWIPHPRRMAEVRWACVTTQYPTHLHCRASKDRTGKCSRRLFIATHREGVRWIAMALMSSQSTVARHLALCLVRRTPHTLDNNLHPFRCHTGTASPIHTTRHHRDQHRSRRKYPGREALSHLTSSKEDPLSLSAIHHISKVSRAPARYHSTDHAPSLQETLPVVRQAQTGDRRAPTAFSIQCERLNRPMEARFRHPNQTRGKHQHLDVACQCASPSHPIPRRSQRRRFLRTTLVFTTRMLDLCPLPTPLHRTVRTRSAEARKVPLARSRRGRSWAGMGKKSIPPTTSRSTAGRPSRRRKRRRRRTDSAATATSALATSPAEAGGTCPKTPSSMSA